MDRVYAAGDSEYAEPRRPRRHLGSEGPPTNQMRAGSTPSRLPLDAGLLAHQLLTPDQLSEWLQIPKQTVYKWRTHGGGPRGYRVGKHLRYDCAEVERWLVAQSDG